MAEGNWRGFEFPFQTSAHGLAANPFTSTSSPVRDETPTHGEHQDSLPHHPAPCSSQTNNLFHRRSQPFNMSTLGAMSSADLVAAALTPRTIRQSQHASPAMPLLSHSKTAQMSMLYNRAGSRLPSSSPIAQLVDKDSPGDLGRHGQKSTADIPGTEFRKNSRSGFLPVDKDQNNAGSGQDEETDEEINEELVDAHDSAKTPITRSARHKQARNDDEGSDYGDDQKPAKKKARKARTPRPTPRRLIRRKPQGIKVPETLEVATEPDKMMWQWKNAGKNWEEIRNEWQRLTGTKPGSSSLSVRYIKLNENFARNGAAGDQELLKFKAEAEAELLSSLWEKVAGKMKSFNDLSEHNPKDLKKRYDLIARSNFDLIKVAEDDKVKEEQNETKVSTPNAPDKLQEDIGTQNEIQLPTGPTTPVRVHDVDSVDRKVQEETPERDDFAQLLPHFNENVLSQRDQYIPYHHDMQTFRPEIFTDENGTSTVIHRGMDQEFPHMTPPATSYVNFPASSPLTKGLVSYASDSD